MCVKLNSLFDSELMVYYARQVLSKVLTSKQCVLTTYLNLETRNCINCKSI